MARNNNNNNNQNQNKDNKSNDGSVNENDKSVDAMVDELNFIDNYINIIKAVSTEAAFLLLLKQQ